MFIVFPIMYKTERDALIFSKVLLHFFLTLKQAWLANLLPFTRAQRNEDHHDLQCKDCTDNRSKERHEVQTVEDVCNIFVSTG